MASLARDVSVVTGLALADLEALWELDSTELAAALGDVLPSALETWVLAASTVAADWYDVQREQSGVAGVFRAIVEPLSDIGTKALIGWATEPLRQQVPDGAAARMRAEDGLQKRLVNTANQTVTRSSAADPRSRGWIRVTSPDACDFCRMVANDSVFRKGTARFACHERCNCSARPIWGGDEVKVSRYRPSERTSRMSDEQRAKLNRAARDWIAANLD